MSEVSAADGGFPPRHLVNRLTEFATSLGFHFPDGFGAPGRQAVVVRSPRSPLALSFELRNDTRRLDIFPVVRTTSWDFDGERTDIHDATSLSFALLAWLKLGLSSSFLYDPGYCSRSEMDNMMLSFPQPHPPGLALDDAGIGAACNLLDLACQCWEALAACAHSSHANGEGMDSDTGYNFEAAEPWAHTILSGIRSGHDHGEFTCARRFCPDWLYFYEYRSAIAVLRLPKFVSTWLVLLSTRHPTLLEGVHGRLIVDGSCRHFVGYKVMGRAARVLQAVGESVRAKELPCVALENRVVFFGQEHVVALFRSTGRAAFEVERECLRGRYETESRLLFPPTAFSWAASPPAEAFEAFICELLAFEPNVVRVRRAGVTRERDGGRDLLADWVVPPTDPKTVDATAVREPVRVVVQCKAASSTVGKGKVQDLRDTVEFHDAAGYFLAVSSELSGPLIAHLERLRTRLRWHVDWWTRLEIEERLRRHPDIAARYPNIVQPIR